MKQKDVTVKQFAMWSFERDQKVGLFAKSIKYDNLPKDEKEAYESEAKHYINKHPKDDWPVDIMKRLSA